MISADEFEIDIEIVLSTSFDQVVGDGHRDKFEIKLAFVAESIL